MKYINNVIVVILLFSIFSFFAYMFKRRKILKRVQIKKKLNEDALRYFVTICHNQLSCFGDENSSSEYVTFRIYGSEFIVLKILKQYRSADEILFLIRASFKGSIILDNDTRCEYSYSGFERLLIRTIGDSLVYDTYVKSIWPVLSRQTKL